MKMRVLFLILLSVLCGCQTNKPVGDSVLPAAQTPPILTAQSLPDQTLPTTTSAVTTEAPSVSGAWYTYARTGNWKEFEQLQKRLDRPWDYQHSNGQTALMMAARNGQIDFIRKLLAKNININLQDQYHYNALSYLLHGPIPIESKKASCLLLVKNGADAFAEDQLKLSPVLVMIENGFIDCLKLVKLSSLTPCDQANRLTEFHALATYAEKEEESNITDYLKSQGCW